MSGPAGADGRTEGALDGTEDTLRVRALAIALAWEALGRAPALAPVREPPGIAVRVERDHGIGHA